MPFELLEESAPTSAKFELIEEPAQVAPQPSPLQSLAPMTAAAVEPDPGIALATAAARAGGGGFISPPAGDASTQLETLTKYGTGLLRYGAPAAAAMAFPPAVMTLPAIAGSSAIAGGAALVGEAAAQGVEVASRERAALEPGRMVSAGVMGATPFVPTRGLAGPLSAAFTGAVKQAAVNEVSFAVSELTRKAIDEGRLPTPAEIADAATQPLNYLPAALGFGIGAVQGGLARPAQQLTAEQRIAQEGAVARQAIEGATGQQAPLTGTQQTGKNIPGEFTATSGEVAAQQAVPENVRAALGVAPDAAPSLAAEAELVAAGDAAARRLGQRVGRAAGKAEGAIEAALQTSMPGSARANSIQEAAQASQGAVRNAEAALSADVDTAYNAYRAEVQNLTAGKDPALFRVTLDNSNKAADDILASLASKEVTDSAGNVTRVPAEFFAEATKRAERIKDIAATPQSVDQIIGLRQAIDDLQSYTTEVAPGFGKRQLGQLRDALKKDEILAAKKLGGNAETLLKEAQAKAQNRFQLLEDNPGILKLLKDPSEKGAFQNPEQIYEALAKQPELLASVKKLVPANDFEQIRRGLFDSLRNPNPVQIGGATFENAGSLANNYRNLPATARIEIAGDAARANQLQSILDDANRVQNAGRSIPVSGGITEEALAEITQNAGGINSRSLRNLVMRDARAAQQNAQRYFNDTAKAVRNRTLNPDIEPDQFVRDFVLKSNNVQVVDDALAQLKPSTAAAVRKQAARVFLDAAIIASGSAQSLEKLAGDKNRLEIARRIIDPGDFKLIEDFMKWSQAKNLTASGGKLEPNKLATVVWRVTKARFLIDSIVGNAGAQDFMSSVSRAPDWLARVKPNMTMQEATALANASKIPLNGMLDQWRRYREESDKAKNSLPKSKQGAFEEVLAVPELPR